MDNILFLDFDDVLNTIRSLYKKFATYHGVSWTEEDFDPKWWGKGHMENINPALYDRVDEAFKTWKGEPGNFSGENYPHDEISIQALNKIVEENQAKVVICSSWRHGRTVKELQQILNKWGAKCKVIGVTPGRRKLSLQETRGEEILRWCLEHKKEIKGICILDDSASYDINWIFEKYCVQGINAYEHGLRDIHIPEAKKCFSESVDFDSLIPNSWPDSWRR